MEIIVQNRDILIMLAIGFGLFMAWGIGANDVANAMGTSVGSGACLLYTSPSPRDRTRSRMPSSA